MVRFGSFGLFATCQALTGKPILAHVASDDEKEAGLHFMIMAPSDIFPASKALQQSLLLNLLYFSNITLEQSFVFNTVILYLYE